MSEEYLPGEVRDRIRDLMKERRISQSELAEQAGLAESTFSRFLNGKTDKLGNDNLAALARAFSVSSDFLLGLTDIPDRKHYDIAELGLSAGAAKALYQNPTNATVVNALLENESFPMLAQMIQQYADGSTAAGYAAQNELYLMISSLLMPANREAAQAVRNLRVPVHQADLANIKALFTKILQQMRDDNSEKLAKSRTLTKKVLNKMFDELPKGKALRKVTPEQIMAAVVKTVEGMDGTDGITAEELDSFRQAALPLFQKAERVPVNV